MKKYVYAIYKKEILKLEVIKETDKQLIVEPNNLYRSTINKRALDVVCGINPMGLFFSDAYIVGFDLDNIISIYNRQLDLLSKSILERYEECLNFKVTKEDL